MPSASERHLIDANVFVYAAVKSPLDAPDVADLQTGSRRVVEALATGNLVGVNCLTVLQEVIYLMARWSRQREQFRTTDPQTALHEAGCRIVRSARVLVDEVLAPSVLEFSRALESHTRQHDFNDLLIVETMRAHSITSITSADRRIETLGMTRREPREWK